MVWCANLDCHEVPGSTCRSRMPLWINRTSFHGHFVMFNVINVVRDLRVVCNTKILMPGSRVQPPDQRGHLKEHRLNIPDSGSSLPVMKVLVLLKWGPTRTIKVHLQWMLYGHSVAITVKHLLIISFLERTISYDEQEKHEIFFFMYFSNCHEKHWSF